MKAAGFAPIACPNVIVEGGIAAGKTTLVKDLEEYLKSQGVDAMAFTEPVPEDGTNPFLDTYYEDPKRWGFTFQMAQLATRAELQLMAQNWASSGKGPGINDRSFYGDTCFLRMLHKAEPQIINDMEFLVYMKHYNFVASFLKFPSICIRVMTSPEVQMQRIEERMKELEERECENTITIEYLRALETEISHVVDVLRSLGVYILDMPYDVNLKDKSARAPVVKNLADHIMSWKPRDPFLEIHRRIAI
jgi:deoxyadenosine/deoxycytidine kinase